MPEALKQTSDSLQCTLASKADGTGGCAAQCTLGPNATQMNGEGEKEKVGFVCFGLVLIFKIFLL